MAAGTVWKGYIAFGLVSIPVRLHPAARAEHVSFHLVHAKDNTRVKQQLWCPTDERAVPREELVNGYEIKKGKFVQVTDEELKKIAPKSTETMEISSFVELADVDPIYYDTSYYVAPEAAGKKAYRLLVAAMEKTGYAAVAKVGMHRREYIVVIRPHQNGLALHTLHYRNEVRAVPAQEKNGAKVDSREVEMAESLIKKLAGPFKPEKFEDEYRTRVQKLIDAKAKGKELKAEPEKKMAPVIDLMEALKQSLAKKKPAAQAKATAVKRAHARAS